MAPRIAIALAATAAALILLSGGCAEATGTEADLAPAAPAVAEIPPAADQAPKATTSTGGSSAYGGAKRAAENTAEKVAQRQAELEKQMEEDE